MHSWVKQVKHGGLFHKLHTFEKAHKQQRKAWREKQLVRPSRTHVGGGGRGRRGARAHARAFSLRAVAVCCAHDA